MTHKIHKHQYELDEERRRHKRANFERLRKLGPQFNYIAGPSQVYAPATPAPADAGVGGGDGAVGTSA